MLGLDKNTSLLFRFSIWYSSDVSCGPTVSRFESASSLDKMDVHCPPLPQHLIPKVQRFLGKGACGWGTRILLAFLVRASLPSEPAVVSFSYVFTKINCVFLTRRKRVCNQTTPGLLQVYARSRFLIPARPRSLTLTIRLGVNSLVPVRYFWKNIPLGRLHSMFVTKLEALLMSRLTQALTL